MDDKQKLLARVVRKTLDLAFRFTEQDELQMGQDVYRWRNWDWSIGVAFYGILQANQVLNDSMNITRIKEWIDARIDGQIKKICINTNAPLPAVLVLKTLYSDPKYENLCRTFDQYLLHEIPRISNGAMTHTTIRSDNSGQVWADTLFMSSIYLAKRGVALNNRDMRREAINQLYTHLQCLSDQKSGLFYHGWDDNAHQFLGVKWGRGNAWITVSTVEILEAITEDYPEKSVILETIHQQLATLMKLQDKDGFWKTVLDQETTYQETTVTSGIAYGVLKGIRLGLIDSKYRPMAERAIRAVLTKISDDGLVQGGSSGTPVKEDAEAYNQIPYAITPYAQGLGLLALSEAEFSSTGVSE